jgi:hypothetical protein
MARTSRTSGLRDRARRCGLRLAVVRRAVLALVTFRVRFGATNGGLRRPELLMLPCPAIACFNQFTLHIAKCRDPAHGSMHFRIALYLCIFVFKPNF